MRTIVFALPLLLALAAPAGAGQASGTVTSPTGTIRPTHAIAYVVRDARNARQTRVELLLTEVPVDGSRLRDDLDPHVTAINVPELRDRNYLLLWVGADGAVSMNATYGQTMTQYLNDASGGLKATFTTRTPAQIAGRVFADKPLATAGGPTYTIDVTFSAEISAPPTGTPLPPGGGEPGQALTAFLSAVVKKDWAGIKAGLGPGALSQFDRSYNTPAENADSAADILGARLPMTNRKVTGGTLLSPTVAVLELEGDRFGSRSLSLVRMVKTGDAWQFEESVPAGMIR